MSTPYPFTAVVGQDDLRLALLLNAVSPSVGGVLVRGEKGTAKIGGTAVNKVEHWEFADPRPEDDGIRAMDSNPPNIYGYGHEGYYRNVLAVLRGDAQPETDGRAGRKSLELILGIYESARTGRDVPLPLKA